MRRCAVRLWSDEGRLVRRATRWAARQELRLGPDDKVLLFFGNIAPYKGVEDLLRALSILVRNNGPFTVVLAGRVKGRSCEPYWAGLEHLIEDLQLSEYVRKEIRYIPDGRVGLFFKASDVSILPYRRVYQSGVLPLSYAQGVPVIAADVGDRAEQGAQKRSGAECASQLRDPVQGNLTPLKHAAQSERERHRRVEVRARDISDRVDHRHHKEARCQSLRYEVDLAVAECSVDLSAGSHEGEEPGAERLSEQPIRQWRLARAVAFGVVRTASR